MQCFVKYAKGCTFIQVTEGRCPSELSQGKFVVPSVKSFLGGPTDHVDVFLLRLSIEIWLRNGLLV